MDVLDIIFAFSVVFGVYAALWFLVACILLVAYIWTSYDREDEKQKITTPTTLQTKSSDSLQQITVIRTQNSSTSLLIESSSKSTIIVLPPADDNVKESVGKKNPHPTTTTTKATTEEEDTTLKLYKAWLETKSSLPSIGHLFSSNNNGQSKEHYFSDKNSKLYQASSITNSDDKAQIAYHECCHAVVAHVLGLPVKKITISKTNKLLGLTLFDTESKLVWNVKECDKLMAGLLASVAGEMKVNNGTPTSQVSDDIDQAWFLAHSMVENFNMRGFISHSKYSRAEKSKQKHDDACLEILTKNLEEARRQVDENEQLINLVAAKLLEKNELQQAEFLEIIKGR